MNILSALPLSCCNIEMGAIGSVNCTLGSPKLHSQGCYSEFLSFINSHALQLGGVAIGIAFVQVINIRVN